jgi:hypothetical protein
MPQRLKYYGFGPERVAFRKKGLHTLQPTNGKLRQIHPLSKQLYQTLRMFTVSS